jgi:hypothetical protein
VDDVLARAEDRVAVQVAKLLFRREDDDRRAALPHRVGHLLGDRAALVRGVLRELVRDLVLVRIFVSWSRFFPFRPPMKIALGRSRSVGSCGTCPFPPGVGSSPSTSASGSSPGSSGSLGSSSPMTGVPVDVPGAA